MLAYSLNAYSLPGLRAEIPFRYPTKEAVTLLHERSLLLPRVSISRKLELGARVFIAGTVVWDEGVLIARPDTGSTIIDYELIS